MLQYFLRAHCILSNIPDFSTYQGNRVLIMHSRTLQRQIVRSMCLFITEWVTVALVWFGDKDHSCCSPLTDEGNPQRSKCCSELVIFSVSPGTLRSYNFRAIFTHPWAGVNTLCSCKYFGNIDNPNPLMQYTNKKVITSIFCWWQIQHEKVSLCVEFMDYLKKCARHFLNLKTSFSWNDPIISTA